MQYWRGIVYLENREEVRVIFCKCWSKNLYSFHKAISLTICSLWILWISETSWRVWFWNETCWGLRVYLFCGRTSSKLFWPLTSWKTRWVEKKSFEPYYNNYQNMVAQYESSELGKSFKIFNLEPSKTGVKYWQKCAFFRSSKWNNWSSVLLEILLGAPY